MARDSRRTPFSGSAFIRLLAALNDAPATATPGAFAERLSRWFDWTDAISLSAALGSSTAQVPEPAVAARPLMNVDERELARVRATLARHVADASSTAVPTPRTSRLASTPIVAPQTPDDFPAYRQRYVACQQAMETSIGPLRRRVRSTLAGAAPALARLADLDAVMEQVIGEQERALLATVPGRLEQRFERLRQAHADACPHADPGATDAPPATWADTFRLDMRDVLLAELELRLQPVEGLLEALRQPPPDRPDRHE
jgi:hypothetical protein